MQSAGDDGVFLFLGTKGSSPNAASEARVCLGEASFSVICAELWILTASMRRREKPLLGEGACLLAIFSAQPAYCRKLGAAGGWGGLLGPWGLFWQKRYVVPAVDALRGRQVCARSAGQADGRTGAQPWRYLTVSLITCGGFKYLSALAKLTSTASTIEQLTLPHCWVSCGIWLQSPNLLQTNPEDFFFSLLPLTHHSPLDPQ